ncbi:MAG: threonine synthase [Deltaproteobacteria bacterium]|nr:threonine synthase [Candidatus Anaeroferrophillacea bacterium]
MRYISTRGGVDPIPFDDAVMMGLAADGGLLLPEEIPAVTPDRLEELAALPYPDLAVEIMAPFIGESVPAAEFERLVRASYAAFDHPDVVPLVRHGDIRILELFHGPTLAFKDVALQFLGNLFAWILARRGESLNIIGATSGDTGSAAIHGVRGRKRINIFMLHPRGRVSPVQERQMTSVMDANVHNIAIEGTFDDGQRIVKEIFGDLAFKERFHLGAVNSINWARVLAQSVYYVSACLQVPAAERRDGIDIVVPTGNFGNIFAGFCARRLGAPIHRLILAANANNILAEFITTGCYRRGTVEETWSPSMDIQVASNFERYLYFLLNCDPAAVRRAMADFAANGELTVTPEQFRRVREDFAAGFADNDETIATIRDFHRETGYILDPHTAVGVRVGRKYRRREGGLRPLVCLATAHPAKFPDAVIRAIGSPPPVPPALQGLEDLPTRCDTLPADTDAVRSYLTALLLRERC